MSSLLSADLKTRAAATLRFGQERYPPGTDFIDLDLRSRAYTEAGSLLPPSLVNYYDGTHAGYYGAVNPLIIAAGWTRGGAPDERLAPGNRLVLGRPAYGWSVHSHIGLMTDMGARVLSLMAERPRGGLEIAPADAAALGRASVLFANVTPETRRSDEKDFDAEPEAYTERFEKLITETRPLLVVATGTEVMRHFFEKAYPFVSRFERVKFTARSLATAPSARAVGLIDFPSPDGSVRVGFLHLPRHPSHSGKFITFRESVYPVAAALATEALAHRHSTRA